MRGLKGQEEPYTTNVRTLEQLTGSTLKTPQTDKISLSSRRLVSNRCSPVISGLAAAQHSLKKLLKMQIPRLPWWRLAHGTGMELWETVFKKVHG